MIYLKDGNIPLNLAYDDDIVQEANSTYQLSFKFPLTDGKWNLLKREVFLLADDLHGEQEFFIFEVKKAKGHVQVYAKQVATLLNYYSINSISVDRVPGQTVMTALAGSVKRPCPFTFFSDILDRHTFNESNVSVMAALAKDKHSIVGQWGGDLVRDKYQVKLLKNGGIENESLFMYKKNLSSYEESENINNLKTRLHLKKTIQGQSEGEADRVIAVTVDSPLIGQYRHIYEADIEVNDQDVTDVASLTAYGQRYFSSTLCDLVENSINLDVKGKSDVSVKMFDTVSVFHERFDVDLRLKITSYHFAPMSKRLKSIGFGKVSQSFGSTVAGMVASSVDKAAGELSASFEQKLQKEIDNANRHFDAEFEKRVEEINDGIEQSRAEAERHADNIKRSIDTEIAQVNQSMQAQVQEHDRQVADILSKTQSVESLANQAKSDAASALARANQVKTEAIADARAQVATVSQALNTAKSELQTAIASADQKARDSQASATALRNDLNMQASKILEQARAQTALTNRVSTVETLADGTRSTVAELSKTVSKATGDIASVTSRTKTVEDTLSQTRTQYESLMQTVNTQTGQIESINRKTADLQSGIDGVTERFESLRIEDNLLLNSSFNQNLNQWQETGVTIVDGKARITGEFNKTKYIYQSIKSQIANDDVSQVYIASISVKVTNYVAGSINPFLALYISGRKNDSVKTWFGATYLTAARLEAVNSRGVVQFTTTFKVNVPRSQIGNIEFNIYARDFTGEVEFEKVSLRRGNIDLGWQASPEDLRSEIASYKRTADEASAELSRQIQLADGKAVEAKTYAQQTATAINTRLESLETYKNAEGARVEQYFTASRDETARQVSALRVAVTQDYVAKSVFEETARGISQRFESLYVGGTNLLTGTDEYTEIFNSEQSHAEFLRTPYDLAPVFDKYGLIEYTLSFDLRASQTGQVAVYQQNGSGSKYSGLWKNLTVTTEWQRFHVTFTPTEGTVSLANSYLAFYGTYGTGVKPIIRRAKIERGAIATDWSPAPEDQQSYADTKIAEYKTTVDGRFATLQSQKANQVDLQTVRETVNLYERIIGSTETGIKDKVARMVMTDSLFLTEVKDKISGTATQVSQLNNSYAIKNLTSAGTVLNQINLLANGTNRIDGRLTHITGQTLIDNGVIKNAMIGELDAGKITSGTVDAARIKANSIDGSKIAFDEAFFNGLSANQAYLKKLFAKDAFLTAVQAVTLSASKIAGGVLEATNGAVRFDLNNANLAFNQNATINFNSDNNALVRKKGDVTAFINFADDPVSGGVYAGIGVTSHAVGVTTANNSDRGKFAGMRVYRPNDTLDLVRLIGDTITLAHGTEGRYFSFKPSQLRNNVDMLKLAGAVYTLSRIFMHLSANGWAFDHPNFIKGVKEEMARNWLQDFANEGLPR
ncbi:phage tail protein [Streptococcus suis]|uniref:phage tail spike protein n=1 Tax=Streptococcus suis TaxID=1307 RepID=UPI001A9A028A|nr:phage tail spike protein [Streptococcus suis]QTA56277.1 phage tail protein [Streptococcus suis]